MNDEVYSQTRHIMMITLGNCLRKDTVFKIDKLLIVMKKVSDDKTKIKIRSIIKDKSNWMDLSGWYLSIIKSLSLDDMELNHILGLKI